MFAMEGQRNSMVLPDQTARLEAERTRMEERLKMLKRVMSVEKSQRGSSGTDNYWKSSKRGPLTRLNPPTHSASQDSSRQEEAKKPLKVKLLTGSDVKSGKSDSHTLCGQCNLYRASMICMECTENYCTACFTKIHQKGALMKHHIRPLASGSVREKKAKYKKTADSNSPTHSSQPEEVVNALDSSQEALKREGAGSLLEGMYDEAASAAAFQEALAEWRRGDKDGACQVSSSKDKEVTTASSCGVQAAISVNDSDMAPLTISFTTSSTASYLEKLLLKKLKKNQALLFRQKKFPENNTSVTDPDNDKDLESNTPSIYNVFYDAEEAHYAQEQDLMGDHNLITSTVLSDGEDTTVEVHVVQVSTDDLESSAQSEHKLSTKDSPSSTKTQSSTPSTADNLEASAQLSTKESPNLTKTQPSAPSTTTTSSQPAIDTAVILAWKECSTAPPPPALSSTFLSNVDKTDADEQQDASTEPDDSYVTEQRLTLGSALWHPNSSIAVTDISPADLPPPSAPSPPILSLVEETNTTSLDLSCQEDEIEEDWEGKEDNRAIDELEWELASTIDGGRETRAALLEEEEDDELWTHVSTQQLMEDFEHYQEKMKEQEDDTV